MRRVIDLETSQKSPSPIELFKGVDLYRTLIVCGVYAAQNLAGNLIANQAVYFFERKLSTSIIAVECVLMTHRGWSVHQYCVCSWPYHLCPTDDLRYALLGPHLLLWPACYLPLGYCLAYCSTNRHRYCWFCWQVERSFSGASFLGPHRRCHVHCWTCSRLVLYYCRNVGHSPKASYHWHWAWRVLHRQHSLHFPLELHAQPNCKTLHPLNLAVTVTDIGVGWRPRRKVRLRLGWHRFGNLGGCILFLARVQRSFLPRD